MLVKVKEELKNSEARGQWAGRTGLVVKVLKSCKAVRFCSGETVKFYHQHLETINQYENNMTVFDYKPTISTIK